MFTVGIVKTEYPSAASEGIDAARLFPQHHIFYVATKAETKQQIETAEEFIVLAEKYCLKHMNEI